MEIWDLYTADRQKTGQTAVRGSSLPEGCYHLVVFACIFNSAGEMLIQQRQPFKDGWPNMWDVTACGSALAGETSQTAMERELHEELGLALNLQHAVPRLTLRSDDCFRDVYLLECEADARTLRLQPEEVQAARWSSVEEIFRMMDEGIFIPDRRDMIQRLLNCRAH